MMVNILGIALTYRIVLDSVLVLGKVAVLIPLHNGMLCGTVRMAVVRVK